MKKFLKVLAVAMMAASVMFPALADEFEAPAAAGEDDLFVPPMPVSVGFMFEEEEENTAEASFEPFAFPAEVEEGIPADHRFESEPDLEPAEVPEEEAAEEGVGEEGSAAFRKEAIYVKNGEYEGEFSGWDHGFTFGGMEAGYGHDFGGYVKRTPDGKVDHGYGVYLGADGRLYIMELEIGGELGSEENNIKSRLVGTVGEFNFNGNASVDFSDGFPVVYVGTEVGAVADSFGGQLGGTIGGVEVSAEGKVVVGCGI